MLRTASGTRPGAYIGSCYVRTLIDHRELAHTNGVKIGDAYLPPKVAVALVDSIVASLKGVDAPQVSRLDERVRRYEQATAPRSQSPTLRKPSEKKQDEPKIETPRAKFAMRASTIASKIPDVTKALGRLCEEITSVGIRVSGPRL